MECCRIKTAATEGKRTAKIMFIKKQNKWGTRSNKVFSKFLIDVFPSQRFSQSCGSFPVIRSGTTVNEKKIEM